MPSSKKSGLTRSVDASHEFVPVTARAPPGRQSERTPNTDLPLGDAQDRVRRNGRPGAIESAAWYENRRAGLGQEFLDSIENEP